MSEENGSTDEFLKKSAENNINLGKKLKEVQESWGDTKKEMDEKLGALRELSEEIKKVLDKDNEGDGKNL